MEHTATIEDVIRVIGQLKPEDRTTLLHQIQRAATGQQSEPVTRESVLIEYMRRLLAGDLDDLPSALGLFARPDLDLSFEEIEADLHEFSTEWKKELDDPANYYHPPLSAGRSGIHSCVDCGGSKN